MSSAKSQAHSCMTQSGQLDNPVCGFPCCEPWRPVAVRQARAPGQQRPTMAGLTVLAWEGGCCSSLHPSSAVWDPGDEPLPLSPGEGSGEAGALTVPAPALVAHEDAGLLCRCEVGSEAPAVLPVWQGSSGHTICGSRRERRGQGPWSGPAGLSVWGWAQGVAEPCPPTRSCPLLLKWAPVPGGGELLGPGQDSGTNSGWGEVGQGGGRAWPADLCHSPGQSTSSMSSMNFSATRSEKSVMLRTCCGLSQAME